MKKETSYLGIAVSIIFFFIGAVGFGTLMYNWTILWSGDFVILLRLILIGIAALSGGLLGVLIIFIIYNLIKYYKDEKKA